MYFYDTHFPLVCSHDDWFSRLLSRKICFRDVHMIRCLECLSLNHKARL